MPTGGVFRDRFNPRFEKDLHVETPGKPGQVCQPGKTPLVDGPVDRHKALTENIGSHRLTLPGTTQTRGWHARLHARQPLQDQLEPGYQLAYDCASV